MKITNPATIGAHGCAPLSPIRQILSPLAKCGLAIALTLLPACDRQPSPPESEPLPQPAIQFPTPPDESDRERQPLPDNVQIYRDDSGLFALALPTGYDYDTRDNGITFLSDDEGFGGVIQFQTTEVKNITPDSLGDVLQQTLEAQFSDVTWQSELEEQPDGSFRREWKGTNGLGEELDALSFIEQHGTTIYILTAFGIDRPYSEYNDDAEIIAGTYVVQENPDTENLDTENLDTENLDTENPASERTDQIPAE